MQIFGALSNKESSDKKRYNNSRCSYLIHVPAWVPRFLDTFM